MGVRILPIKWLFSDVWMFWLPHFQWHRSRRLFPPWLLRLKNVFSEENEPLLWHNDSRLLIFPIQYEDMWKTSTSEQRHLTGQRRRWINPTGEVLNRGWSISFPMSSPIVVLGIVVENRAYQFCRDVQIPETRFFYGFQMMMENIHSEMYSLLIDTYIEDSREKRHLFKAGELSPLSKRKPLYTFEGSLLLITLITDWPIRS